MRITYILYEGIYLHLQKGSTLRSNPPGFLRYSNLGTASQHGQSSLAARNHALGYPHPNHDLLGTQWAQHHSISMNEREKAAESARRIDSAWIASFAHPYISDNGCWLKLITCNAAAAAAPVPKQSHCTPQQTPPQNAEGSTQQCCADCG